MSVKAQAATFGKSQRSLLPPRPTSASFKRLRLRKPDCRFDEADFTNEPSKNEHRWLDQGSP